MGQTQSDNLKSVDLSSLIKTEKSNAINRSLTINNDVNKRYTVVVPLTGKDDVISNIRIPDAEYKNVLLTVGTHVFNGTLGSDSQWCFNCTIPLFKIPDEPCHLTIYTLKDEQSSVNLKYQSFPGIKSMCRETSIKSDGLIYSNGHVV
jgi:hypothetical protein